MSSYVMGEFQTAPVTNQYMRGYRISAKGADHTGYAWWKQREEKCGAKEISSDL